MRSFQLFLIFVPPSLALGVERYSPDRWFGSTSGHGGHIGGHIGGHGGHNGGHNGGNDAISTEGMDSVIGSVHSRLR